MQRGLLPVQVGPTTPDGTSALRRLLAAALDGSGPAIAPVRAPAATVRASPGGSAPAHDAVPQEVAVVLRTSGSTGEPRALMLDGAALQASARATHDRLGGPGRWLLALPTHHVAGLQVLVRAGLAGLAPAVLDLSGGFDPAALVRAAGGVPDDAPLYTSLVPTQLHRLLAWSGGSADRLAPLRRARVLVGGAALAPTLIARCREAGLDLVETYGMTETCGGCVYDGRPLDGVGLAVAPDGTVRVAGPVLARGHLGRPDLDAEAFVVDGGRRWLRTRDLARLDDGVLRLQGRADDVLLSGGVKVAPAAVEATLATVAGVGQVCVVGVPDPEWGQAVTAVVVPDGDPPSLADLRAAARTLGDAAAPRHLVLVDVLDEKGPGKVDRAALTRRARTAVETEEDHGERR